MKISVDKQKTASFDIDAQKGFTPLCPNELPVPDGHLIVDELNKNATKAAYRIGSKDVHPNNAIWLASADKPQFSPVDGENVDIRWNAHCMSGTYGAELLDGLPKVSEYNFFAFKGCEPDLHPYSPCYHDLKKTIRTGVIEWLLVMGVDTVILGGLALNYCLGEGGIDLVEDGFRVIVNLSATKGIGDEEQLKAYVEKLKGLNIIVVDSADDIVVE